MGVLLFLTFALVVGFLARAIMPGPQRMGWLGTTLVGVAGSFIGGFVGALLTSTNRVLDFDTAALVGSVLGALLALAIGEAGLTRRARRTRILI